MIRLAAAAAALLLGACSSEPAPAPWPPLQFDRLAAQAGPAALAREGERLGRVLGCSGCHGEDLTGHGWIEEPQVAVLFTSNLTRAAPDYDDAQLDRAIRLGVRPDGSHLWAMPSHIFTHLSATDMAALIAWLRTVPPRGEAHPRIVIGPEGRRMIAAGEVRPEPELVRARWGEGPERLDPAHDRARYMIRATCSECHGIDLSGEEGTPDIAAPPDLAIVGAYARDAFLHLLRTGEAPHGRDLGLMAEVARGRFAHLTVAEADAIYDYLSARARAR